MIEAKIVLLMFVWPMGQANDRPLWTSDAYVSVESCEEDAVVLKAKFSEIYRSGVRIEHHCIHLDDRLDK